MFNILPSCILNYLCTFLDQKTHIRLKQVNKDIFNKIKFTEFTYYGDYGLITYEFLSGLTYNYIKKLDILIWHDTDLTCLQNLTKISINHILETTKKFKPVLKINLTNLESINCKNIYMTTTEPFLYTTLRKLKLINTNNILDLKLFTNLKKIYVDEISIAKIKKINVKYHTGLKKLKLKSNKCKNLPSAVNINCLRLYIDKNSYESLVNLKYLVYLDISYSSVEIVPSLPILQKLKLIGSFVLKIENMPSLKYLDISDTAITEINNLTHITTLICSLHSCVLDISQFTNLVTLDISCTEICEISNLVNLQYLYCQFNTAIRFEHIINLNLLEIQAEGTEIF